MLLVFDNRCIFALYLHFYKNTTIVQFFRLETPIKSKITEKKIKKLSQKDSFFIFPKENLKIILQL